MRVLLSAIILIPYLLSFSFYNEILTNTSSRSFALVKSISADTLVKMERTICYGTCPSYELHIQENGKVTFLGKQFVEHKGWAEGTISDENLGQLIEVIQNSRFMEIPSNPKCESKYTDMPSVFLTIEVDGERNSVTHYHGCKGFQYEEELYRLEASIDSLAGTGKWIEGEG